jgi:predicted DNA-binding transcriptional regulator AlpA
MSATVIRFPVERSRAVKSRLLTKPELAAKWGVSQRWIEYQQDKHGLPKEKDGPSRFVRYDEVKVESWRAKRLVAHTQTRRSP